MREMKILQDYLSKEEEAKDILRLIMESLVERVYEEDEEALFLPGDINEDEKYVVWSLRPFYEEELEEGAGEEDEEELEEAEGRRLTCEVGVYFWSPEDFGPAASIYVIFDGGPRGLRWRLLNKMARKLKGKIFLTQEEWTEDEAEIKRLALEDFGNPEELVETLTEELLETGEKVIDILAAEEVIEA